MAKHIKYPTNANYFDEINANSAYILGFLLSDACVDRGRTIKIHIARKDCEILEFIRDEITPTRPIKHIDRSDIRTGSTYETSLLAISSKKLVDSMERFGMSNKKENRHFFVGIPDRFMPDYCRGIFDADGNVSINYYEGKALLKIGVTSSNREMLSGLRHFIGSGEILDIHNCSRLMFKAADRKILGNKIYNGHFHLRRKYTAYLQLLEMSRKMKRLEAAS